MLKDISLIASAVCGITAVTTSLRALGRSREMARCENDERVRTCCRADDHAAKTPYSGSSLILHFIVTVVWYGLAVAFALPLVGDGKASMIQFLPPFLLLTVLLAVIWRKVLQKRT